MPEFKPCPFCGGTEISATQEDSYLWNPSIFNIQCNECSADVWLFIRKENKTPLTYYEARMKAAEKWNRRNGNAGDENCCVNGAGE